MTPRPSLWLLLASIAASPPVWAGEGPADPWGKASLHGDVKTFSVAGASQPWFGLSDESVALVEAAGLTKEQALELYGLNADPYAQGLAGGRLKAVATWRNGLRLDVHWAIAGQSPQPASIVAGASSGIGLTAPEAVKLTWVPDTGAGLTLQHRFDRAVLSAKLPHVDIALGRQPVSFGTGLFFTPLDVVNPFHPATIDTEYKPGVDALRIDAYAGTSSKITAALAYAGSAPLLGEEHRDRDNPLLQDLVIAILGQGTLGVTDILGFAGSIRGEPVFGLGTATSIGPVGVHAEATLTLPQPNESAADADAQEPFFRAVAGADFRPTATTTLMGEAYIQTFGASSPDGYLAVAASERFSRGEVWQMGRTYGSLSVAQEITPLIVANVALMANLEDPSALVLAGASWSVADNATVALGAYLPLGARPDEIPLDLAIDAATQTPMLIPPTTEAIGAAVNSEFGLYPRMFYLQVRTYF